MIKKSKAAVKKMPEPVSVAEEQPVEQTKSQTLAPYITKRLAIVGGGVLILAIATIPSVYFYNQYRTVQKNSSQPAVLGKNEIEDLIKKIGKLILLPEGEVPTIATVTDKKVLQSQDFFKRAENGDKVLIYAGARKAFLYRPTENKIVEVGPVNLPTGDPASAPIQPSAQPDNQSPSSPSGTITPTIEAKINVVVLNGTNSQGLGKEVSDRLTENIEGVTILKRDNARRRDYTKSEVIDITGQNKAKVEEIAGYLDADVQIDLPDGEVKPNADILVIAAE